MRRAKLAIACATLALAAIALPASAAVAASRKTTTTVARQPPAAQAPAATGQIAYISGKTLEVRNPETGQTTVEITAKTLITATVAVSLSSVKAGTCVTVTGTKAKGGALDANSVTLSSATTGCLRRGGSGRFFGGASGGGGYRHVSSGSSTRRRFGVPGNFATAFGKVVSVSSSTITVDGTVLSFSGRAASSRPRARTTALQKPKKISVVVSSKTRYLRTGPARASSLRVGECATAFGPTNNIGAVTAARLLVSPPTSGSCFGGFGAFGPFGRPGAAGT